MDVIKHSLADLGSVSGIQSMRCASSTVKQNQSATVYIYKTTSTSTHTPISISTSTSLSTICSVEAGRGATRQYRGKTGNREQGTGADSRDSTAQIMAADRQHSTARQAGTAGYARHRRRPPAPTATPAASVLCVCVCVYLSLCVSLPLCVAASAGRLVRRGPKWEVGP